MGRGLGSMVLTFHIALQAAVLRAMILRTGQVSESKIVSILAIKLTFSAFFFYLLFTLVDNR